MFDSLFFVQAAGDKAPTLTIGGLPLCVIPQKDEADVGMDGHGSSLDDAETFEDRLTRVTRTKLCERFGA